MLSAICACLLLLALIHRDEHPPQMTRARRKALMRQRLRFNPSLRNK